MHALSPAEYRIAAPVFEPMSHHLAIAAILNGAVPARVYVDDPARPRTAMAWYAHRMHLAGAPDSRAFNLALGRLFAEAIRPQLLAGGYERATLYYEPNGWEQPIENAILAGAPPVMSMRQYYRLKGPRLDWRATLPEGFELRPVDAALFEHARLKHLDALREEMCSERPSVQEFLDHSFGVCLVHGDELAGWCLSEYNTPDACEIGIETREPFRRRGLAALMTAALVEEAQARGVARIGWHCWTSNIPSARTALKAGFELAVNYPACMVWFDEAVNLAAHGAECLDRACYGEAIEWFERAFERAADTAPGWAHWGAACAAARLELHDIALRHLTAALNLGFGDLEHLQSSEHLESLRQTAGWRVMLAARAGGSPTPTNDIPPTQRLGCKEHA